jgi:hypothetical protein
MTESATFGAGCLWGGEPAGSRFRHSVPHRDFLSYPEQEAIAKKSREAVEASGKFRRPIATEITAAGKFYRAEDLSPEVFAKARSRFLAFLIDLPGVRGEPASPRSSRVKESLELAHKPGEWERLSLTNQRAPGALGRPKCDSLPVVSRAGIRELRRAQFSAATAFAVTGCGSANCSQKPIISSSLGSPQRTALDGSGFKGLLLELSK